MQDKELYFIALVPDEPVYSEIWHLKEEMLDRFDTKAALRSPPHITLHMPFKWPEKKEAILSATLQSIASAHEVFTLTLNNFGAFEPRVIYVDVENTNKLINLRDAVVQAARSQWHLYPKPGGRPFRPHMTIAFRDLKKARFYEAWKEFEQRKYKSTMSVHSICLLKHNGRKWEQYQHFKLKEKVQQ